MLFYSVYCLCFFAILASRIATKEKTTPADAEKSEGVFADVIKNISRVNNVLQELINNYEHLQKIYKSQENFDSIDYSGDVDGDHFFKNDKSYSRDRERSFSQYSSKSSANYLRVTQMILYDKEEAYKSREITTKPTKEHKLGAPKIENVTIEKIPSLSKINKEVDTSLSSIEKSNIEETLGSTKTTASAKKIANTPSIAKAEAELVFVDTHKNIRTADKKKHSIQSQISIPKVTKKIKTRYNVKEMPGTKDASYGVVKTQNPLHEKKNSTKSKRFLQTETVNVKKSHNKSQGMADKEKKAINKEAEIKASVHLRTTNNNNRSIFVADTVNNPGELKSSEMTDDDEALIKDLFKTSVLRQAYGDACLKLVVRKCYKACKNVLKSSCRSVKCKSDIKSFYKETYKTSCDKAFEDSPNAFRRTLKNEGPHPDFTREGYLSVACQQRPETGMPIVLHNDQTTQNAVEKGKGELNILRAKYEKACHRISRDKCNSACNYAQNATCVKYECEKNLKKNFKRNCKIQCKIAYTSKSKDDSSDSDSDSDSDDSYESDSSDSDSDDSSS